MQNDTEIVDDDYVKLELECDGRHGKISSFIWDKRSNRLTTKRKFYTLVRILRWMIGMIRTVKIQNLCIEHLHCKLLETLITKGFIVKYNFNKLNKPIKGEITQKQRKCKFNDGYNL